MKKILLFTVFLLVCAPSFAQLRMVEVNRDAKAAIGVMPYKIITDYIDVNTGKLDHTTVALRDRQYQQLAEYVFFNFNTHEEAKVFFSGLMKYIGDKNLRDTYHGYSVLTSSNGKYFHFHEPDSNAYAYIDKKTHDWIMKSLD